MKGRIKFVRPNNLFVPEGDTYGAKTIASWLGNDIQYSQGNADEWTNIISDVIDGNRTAGYQGTGNTHSVMVMDNAVYIECEYSESRKVFMTPNQAKEVLQKYINFLNSNHKLRGSEIGSFDVEYEAEGEAALDKYLKTGGTLGQ